jgi:hypothetical protein
MVEWAEIGLRADGREIPVKSYFLGAFSKDGLDVKNAAPAARSARSLAHQDCLLNELY